MTRESLQSTEVALFVPSLRGGGAERVMVNLARGLTERGLPVDLVLAKAEGPYLAELHPKVRVVDLGARRVLFALPGLVRYLRQERPQTMLSTLNHANIVALWARKLAHVPTQLVIREANIIGLSSANAPSIKGRAMPLLMRLFYGWADAVVANSQGSAEELTRLVGVLPHKVKVIYNPVVRPDLFAKAAESLDDPWFSEGEPAVVLGVGRLTEQKDFPTLIRAFALVRRHWPVRLMILGEGEVRPQLEALVRELDLDNDVKIPGFVDNPYKYMKRAGVFALSSRWEGLPNALIEALALGTPVVATDCPSGPAEILEDGKWGRLVPVGDDAALAEAILATLAEPRRLQAAQQRMRERFGLEAVVEQYLDVLGLR
ncbi:MAG: glycosyltransferase [Candidatus Bipolaricaulis sp.]|nr:glycosyltransferase [Candidatus Bipolaricaulis sp.]